jgi:hypothetical protein
VDLGQSIDLYCERIGPGGWAEPVNFLSNGAFLLAAALAWRKSSGLAPDGRRPVLLLVGLLSAIGVGSGLFHSFATLWAQALDVAPIALYILATLYLWLRDAHGDSRQKRLAALGTLLLLSALFGAFVPPHLVNGSQGYFGVLAVMVWLALRERHARVPGRHFMVVSGVFALSLSCRMLDLSLCPTWPLGTHFLWHVFNAVVCYVPLRGYISIRQAMAGAVT